MRRQPCTRNTRISPPLSIGLRVKGRLEDVVSVLENRGISFHVQTDAEVKLAFFTDPDRNPLYLYEDAAPHTP